MRYSGSTEVVPRVVDAALRPASWPLALQAIAESVGAIGVACIVKCKETARVKRTSLRGDGLRSKSSLGLRVLDQVAAAEIVTAPRGRLIEINRSPETILTRGDAWSAPGSVCAREVGVGFGGLLRIVAGDDAPRARTLDG